MALAAAGLSYTLITVTGERAVDAELPWGAGGLGAVVSEDVVDPGGVPPGWRPPPAESESAPGEEGSGTTMGLVVRD